MPDWITTYLYGVGNLDEITQKKCKTIPINKDLNYKELISPTEDIILRPKFIGIYQEREPAKEDIEERIERLHYEEKLTKLDDMLLSRWWDSNDFCHNELIHIIYDNSIIPSGEIKIAIKDKINRITLSQLDSVPNFNEKDIYLFYEAICESVNIENLESKSPNELREINKKFLPKFQEIAEQFKHFGFTKNEWVSVYKHFLGL